MVIPENFVLEPLVCSPDDLLRKTVEIVTPGNGML